VQFTHCAVVTVLMFKAKNELVMLRAVDRGDEDTCKSLLKVDKTLANVVDRANHVAVLSCFGWVTVFW
jgi:hypothetical protein